VDLDRADQVLGCRHRGEPSGGAYEVQPLFLVGQRKHRGCNLSHESGIIEREAAALVGHETQWVGARDAVVASHSVEECPFSEPPGPLRPVDNPEHEPRSCQKVVYSFLLHVLDGSHRQIG
jgi:hypothetical protein